MHVGDGIEQEVDAPYGSRFPDLQHEGPRTADFVPERFDRRVVGESRLKSSMTEAGRSGAGRNAVSTTERHMPTTAVLCRTA
ncbi:MAG: hypothetical protein U0Q12_02280 [Vicinamibacterales bacterium]